MIGLSLEGGNRVEVGDHGERWLVTSRGRRLANGFVPEPIIGVVASSSGEIGFATRDGTVYPVKAADPLGPVGEPRRPPRALTKIAFGAHAMIARAGRDLVRSSDVGRTWTPVDIGGAPRVLESIALARDGTGALLQLPQRTLVTDDDGLTWSHATSPPHGVSEVKSEDDRARVVAYSISAQTTMQVAGKPPRWIPPRPSPPPSPSSVAANEPVLGYLSAWTTGEGVMAGTSWLEVTGSETGPELWIEDLTGVAPNRRLAAFAGCGDLPRVAASPDGHLLGVTCRKSPRSHERLVFRSVDAGAHWQTLPPVVGSASAFALGIHVVGDHLIVKGACAVDHASANDCPLLAASSTGGAWTNLPLATKLPKQLRLEDVAANATGTGFVGVAYDDDGDIVYAISAPTLDRSEVTRTFDALGGVEQLSWDGTVVVLQGSSAATPLFLSRDAGITWSAQPFGHDLDDREGVSFAGARGLAITPTDVLESLDAGATWSKIDAPPLPGPHGVRCGPRGCLLDDTLRRIGWSATAKAARPRGPSNERKTIAISDPGAVNPLFTCARNGKSTAFQGTIDSPLVDLPGGVNASFLLYQSDGVKILRERGGAREVLGPVKHSQPLGFQVVQEAEGAAFAEFPGECALDCHGFLYSSTGPIAVSWLPSSGGPIRRVSFTPDHKMLREPIDAAPTADGGVIVAVAGDAYVFDASGKRTKKVRGHAWDVVSIDKKTYSATGALTLLENGATTPATTWVFEPFASERAHVVRARGHSYAWMQAKTDACATFGSACLVSHEAFLVKLDKIEEEPSTVIGIDAEKLLATTPLPLCTAKTRGELRIPITFDPPSPFRVALPDPSEPTMLAITDVVLRSNTEGKACVSGLVARSANRREGVMIDVADPSHATTWKNEVASTTAEPARCTPGPP